ncbi:metallophosphoesterase, partial [Sulfolobus sp. D5]
MVSDVHKAYRVYRGYNQSVAVEWLLEVIDKTNPQILISAGDWDVGM